MFTPQHPEDTRISLIEQVLYQLVVDQQAPLIRRIPETFFMSIFAERFQT